MDEGRSPTRPRLSPDRVGACWILLERERRAGSRGWRLGASLVAHTVLLGLVVLVPLLATEPVSGGLPWQNVLLIAPPKEGPAEGRSPARLLEKPLKLSGEVQPFEERFEAPRGTEAPEVESLVNPLGVPDGAPWGVLGGTGPASSPPAPYSYFRVGGRVKPPELLEMVKPEYPPQAKFNGIEGNVVLEVKLSRRGRVTGVRVVSGHSELATSAVEAVRQWVYEPAHLNEVPIPVRMKVVVQFELQEPGGEG